MGEEMNITREDLEYIGNALEDCQSIATGYCAALGTRGDKIREQFWHANANEALAKIDEILKGSEKR